MALEIFSLTEDVEMCFDVFAHGLPQKMMSTVVLDHGPSMWLSGCVEV